MYRSDRFVISLPRSLASLAGPRPGSCCRSSSLPLPPAPRPPPRPPRPAGAAAVLRRRNSRGRACRDCAGNARWLLVLETELLLVLEDVCASALQAPTAAAGAIPSAAVALALNGALNGAFTKASKHAGPSLAALREAEERGRGRAG